MINQNCFCFIPAKLGSTRLPEKNIKKLNGKPLIEYQIDLALNSNLFKKNDIIVSTESEKIKEISLKSGATVPYLREKNLAADPHGIVDVLYDFLMKFESYKEYHTGIILLATSPLTKVKDLIEAYEKFKKNNFSSLMTVTETDHNSHRAVILNGNLINPIFPIEFQKRSQEIEKTYRVNGAITIVKVSEFLKNKDYCISPWGSHIMPKSRSIDIDSLDDFRMAEYYQNKSEKNPNPC